MRVSLSLDSDEKRKNSICRFNKSLTETLRCKCKEKCKESVLR